MRLITILVAAGLLLCSGCGTATAAKSTTQNTSVVYVVDVTTGKKRIAARGSGHQALAPLALPAGARDPAIMRAADGVAELVLGGRVLRRWRRPVGWPALLPSPDQRLLLTREPGTRPQVGPIGGPARTLPIRLGARNVESLWLPGSDAVAFVSIAPSLDAFVVTVVDVATGAVRASSRVPVTLDAFGGADVFGATPDGRLVLARSARQPADVVLVDPATAEQSAPLSFPDGADGVLIWSPDGTRGATFAGRDLFVTELGAGGALSAWRRIPGLPAGASPFPVAWAPSDARLAVLVSRGGAVEVWIVDLTGPVPRTTRLEQRFTSMPAIMWSADGTRLAYPAGNPERLRPLRGGDRRDCATDSVVGDFRDPMVVGDLTTVPRAFTCRAAGRVVRVYVRGDAAKHGWRCESVHLDGGLQVRCERGRRALAFLLLST